LLEEKPHLLAEPERLRVPEKRGVPLPDGEPSLKALSMLKLPPKEPNFGSCGTTIGTVSTSITTGAVDRAAGTLVLRKKEEKGTLRVCEVDLFLSAETDRFSELEEATVLPSVALRLPLSGTSTGRPIPKPVPCTSEISFPVSLSNS